MVRFLNNVVIPVKISYTVSVCFVDFKRVICHGLVVGQDEKQYKNKESSEKSELSLKKQLITNQDDSEDTGGQTR